MSSMIFELIHEVSNNSILVGVITVILLFFLNKRYGFCVLKIEDQDSEASSENGFSVSTTHCSDRNCVRCSKYRSVLKIATQRLNKIEDGDISQKIKLSLTNEIPVKTESKIDQNPNVFLYNSLSAKTFWNNSQLTHQIQQDVLKLEQSMDLILKEFQNVYSVDHTHSWKRNSTDTGSWDVFHLINQGVLVRENAKLCPHTTDTVQSLTSALKDNVFGNVLFSVVKPSTLISPHYGPTNIRLRCHLGLVTNSKCVLHVGSDQAAWKRGKCVIFDDSFLHSVEHFGSELNSPQVHKQGEVDGASLLQQEDRAVLIVDIWHPDLLSEEMDALNYLFSPE